MKEKVSSSAIRALGFLLADIDIDFLCSDVFGPINRAERKDIPLLSDFNKSPLDEENKLNYCHSIQKVLIKALNNKSSKVTWNACVAIAKAL